MLCSRFTPPFYFTFLHASPILDIQAPARAEYKRKEATCLFEYVFTSEDPEKEILTDGFCSIIHDVKRDILNKSSDCIHRRSTYPNGFIIEMEQRAGEIIIRTNWELSDNGDGTISVIQP